MINVLEENRNWLQENEEIELEEYLKKKLNEQWYN